MASPSGDGGSDSPRSDTEGTDPKAIERKWAQEKIMDEFPKFLTNMKDEVDKKKDPEPIEFFGKMFGEFFKMTDRIEATRPKRPPVVESNDDRLPPSFEQRGASSDTKNTCSGQPSFKEYNSKSPVEMFQAYYSQLTDIISPDVVRVCVSLIPLIGTTANDDVHTAGFSNYEKASRLMSRISTQLKAAQDQRGFLLQLLELFLDIDNPTLTNLVITIRSQMELSSSQTSLQPSRSTGQERNVEATVQLLQSSSSSSDSFSFDQQSSPEEIFQGQLAELSLITSSTETMVVRVYDCLLSKQLVARVDDIHTTGITKYIKASRLMCHISSQLKTVPDSRSYLLKVLEALLTVNDPALTGLVSKMKAQL